MNASVETAADTVAASKMKHTLHRQVSLYIFCLTKVIKILFIYKFFLIFATTVWWREQQFELLCQLTN